MSASTMIDFFPFSFVAVRSAPMGIQSSFYAQMPHTTNLVSTEKVNAPPTSAHSFSSSPTSIRKAAGSNGAVARTQSRMNLILDVSSLWFLFNTNKTCDSGNKNMLFDGNGNEFAISRWSRETIFFSISTTRLQWKLLILNYIYFMILRETYTHTCVLALLSNGNS